MLHNLPLDSPYPFMPSHSSLSSFFVDDFEIVTLCLCLPVLATGKNDDFVIKVKCENPESWNLFSSIAEMGVCEETLHLSVHQLLHLAKKFILILHKCVWFEICTQKADIEVFELFLLIFHVINFGCENIVFLFPFQLPWKRRGRRKVNQLFSLDWSVFQAVTAVRNVSFIQWYNCDDIHHLMCYHQLALSTPTVITQLSFPVLLAPFYHRPTQPSIRHFIILVGKRMKGFCYHVRICQREQNSQCTVHADLAVCSLQKALS